MTREEAIAIIENEKKCVNRANKNDYCNRDCYNCELVKTDIQILTALDMAIKALEQEPCEVEAVKLQQEYSKGFEDCRYAVLNLFNKSDEYNWELSCIRRKIEKIPFVTPQQKTGHWILQPSNKEQGERDFIWWKCSECGQVIFSETEKDRREYHAFCAKCGTRMVEEQERSEE